MIGGWFSVTAAETLLVAGTGDSQALLRKLAVLYKETYPGSEIIVPDSVGSGGGIKAVIEGTAGLGRTARALKPKEKDHGLTAIPFALSPIVFVTHPSGVNVKNVTPEDVVKIYSGKVTNWRQLGGDEHKIYPVDREPGDSSRTILAAQLHSSLGTFNDIQSVGKVFFTTPETVQAIAQNRYTFGFVPLSFAQEAKLHIFSLSSVFPDEDSIQDGSYPLVTTFYLVKPAHPKRLATDFLNFLQEPAAQELMHTSGVIPVGKTDH